MQLLGLDLLPSFMALVVKNPPANAVDPRDLGSVPGSGRSHREGNGNSFQYPCLKKSVEREDWWAIVHGVAKSHAQPSTAFKYMFRSDQISCSVVSDSL